MQVANYLACVNKCRAIFFRRRTNGWSWVWQAILPSSQ